MKKKILLPYATYGTGHRAIAKYIEEYFHSRGDYEIMTLDIKEHFDNFFNKISDSVFEKTSLKGNPFLWSILYKFNNHRLTSAFAMKVLMKFIDTDELKKIILDFNPDLVISTHFYSSSLISKYIKKGILDTKLITVVTDYEAHDFWLKAYKGESAIVVGDKLVKSEIKNKDIDPDIIKPIGIPISTRFNEDLYDHDEIVKKYKIDTTKKTALFYGGGGLGNLSSLPYLEKIASMKLKLNILFVAGNNANLKIEAEKIVKKYHANNITVFGFVNYIPEMLSVCDFVITKPGGATITECLCLKKPMLLIDKNVGQEKANYKYLEKKGFGIKIKSLKSFAIIMKIVEVNPAVIYHMQKRMTKLENDKAIVRLYNLALKLLK